MYLGHVSGRKVVPDCRRLGRDRRLQIVGCKKDIPCVLASTLIKRLRPGSGYVALAEKDYPTVSYGLTAFQPFELEIGRHII